MEERAKKPFLFLAYVISFVGFYFTSWTFLDESLYTTEQELIISFISAAGVIIVIYFLNKLVSDNSESITITALKSKIRFVMRKMTVDAVKGNHVMNKKRWQEEIVEPTLDKLHE